MIRIAFTLIGGENWTGGRNYLTNLLRALAIHQADRVKPLLFTDPHISEEELATFASIPGVEVIRSMAMSPRRKLYALLSALVWGYDSKLRAELLAHRVDLVFEAAQFFGWRLGVPALAWIPDFQHRALPNLFTWRGFLRRELGFRAQVAAGRTIMVSSEDARANCERYYPSTVGRTAIVRFAVAASDGASEMTARGIADQYGLPVRFFFLPNQFWQHKNHRLVLEALAILQGRGDQVVIAATGKQFDPRNPGYFDELQATSRKRGLTEQFRLLGLVPHEHVSALMICCVALLNPSRFEGWSTSVEEARSLGTPLLLSNIAVHREQAGESATYFDPDDAETLAAQLRDFVSLAATTRSSARAASRVAAELRVRKFSQEFVEVAQKCVVGTTMAR